VEGVAVGGSGGEVGSGGRTEEACGGGNEANRALVSLAFGVSALLPRSPAFSFPLHAPEALARSLLFCRLLLPAAPLTPALELAERRGSGDGPAPFRRTGKKAGERRGKRSPGTTTPLGWTTGRRVQSQSSLRG